MSSLSVIHWLIVGAIVYAIVRFLRGRRAGKASMVELQGDGQYSAEVVGESHYQDALERIVGGRTKDGAEHYCVAHLVLEEKNPHDANAVRVEIDGMQVGYLPRRYAVSYRKQIARAGYARASGVAQAVIRGGWQRRGETGKFGVWLDIPLA